MKIKILPFRKKIKIGNGHRGLMEEVYHVFERLTSVLLFWALGERCEKGRKNLLKKQIFQKKTS